MKNRDKKRVTVTIPFPVWKKMNEKSASLGIRVSSLASIIICDNIQRDEEKNEK